MKVETNADAIMNVRTLAEAVNEAANKVFGKKLLMVQEILGGAMAVYEQGTQEQLLASLVSVVKNKLQFNFTSNEIVKWPFVKNSDELESFFNGSDLKMKVSINIERGITVFSDLKSLKIESANIDLSRVEDMLNEIVDINYTELYARYQRWLNVIKSTEFQKNVKQRYVYTEIETNEDIEQITEPLMKKFALKKVYFETLLRLDKSVQLPDMKVVGRILNASNLSDKEKREYLIRERLKKIVQVMEFPYTNQKYISLVKDREIEEFLELANVKIEIAINLLESEWEVENAYIDWSKLSEGRGWNNKYYVAKELGLKVKEKENETGQIEYFVDYNQFAQATCKWIESNLVVKLDILKEDVSQKIKDFREKSDEIV